MRAALLGGITFVLCGCAIAAFFSVFLALLTGNGAAPQPIHVLLGLFIGGVLALVPTAIAVWLARRPTTSR